VIEDTTPTENEAGGRCDRWLEEATCKAAELLHISYRGRRFVG
jgi:hypothetical protein